jgi:hypothetical protein
MSEQEQAHDEAPNYLALLFSRHEVHEVMPGIYQHTFTPPEMTMADLARLLSKIPPEEVSHETSTRNADLSQ